MEENPEKRAETTRNERRYGNRRVGKSKGKGKDKGKGGRDKGKGRGRGAGKAFDGTCHHCGKKGHMAR